MGFLTNLKYKSRGTVYLTSVLSFMPFKLQIDFTILSQCYTCKMTLTFKIIINIWFPLQILV